MTTNANSTTDTTSRKDHTMDNVILTNYLRKTDMRALPHFPGAIGSLTEGDIVSIAYATTMDPDDIHVVLRQPLTIEDGVLGVVDSALERHVSVNYAYDRDTVDVGLWLRAIAYHTSDDEPAEFAFVPKDAPSLCHEFGCNCTPKPASPAAVTAAEAISADIIERLLLAVLEDDEPEVTEGGLVPEPSAEVRLEWLKDIRLGTKVSADFGGERFSGVLGLDDDEDYLIVTPDDGVPLYLTAYGEPDMAVTDITFYGDPTEFSLSLGEKATKGWGHVNEGLQRFSSTTSSTSRPMTPNEFQEKALSTAVFPGQGTFWGLQYATAGLSNEAGEVQGKIKKMQRDKGYTPDDVFISKDDRTALLGELGDVAWYLAVAADQADILLSEVFSSVVDKLADRAERGVLGGSGDNR